MERSPFRSIFEISRYFPGSDSKSGEYFQYCQKYFRSNEYCFLLNTALVFTKFLLAAKPAGLWIANVTLGVLTLGYWGLLVYLFGTC